MSKILYEVYQNDIKDSESVMFGKWYARLKSIETLSTEKLAKHISEHGSVFTADVVEGVMKRVEEGEDCRTGHVLPDLRVPEGRCRQGGGLQREPAPQGAPHPIPARSGSGGQPLQPRVHQEG